MWVFSFRNKVRLCSAIFATLIFFDIVAFFDALSQEQGAGSQKGEQSYDIEREIINRSPNKTTSTKEETVDGEMVHNIAILLVEVFGLTIVLVGDHILISSYPHMIIFTYHNILISWWRCWASQSFWYILLICPHILIFSYPNILIFSCSHIIIFACHNILISSYSHI